MAELKITQLPAATTASTDDLIEIVDDPSGTPTSKKITVANFLSFLYPVGHIYTSTVSTSPATLFGFGTWSAFAAGRVLVGIDAGQTEFDAVEETGGAKTHTLLTTEIPAHTHVLTELRDATTGGSTTNIALSADTSSTTGTKVSGSTGGGGAHNNLQPYVVVYMWKRTA